MYSNTKVGGIRFITLGGFQFSICRPKRLQAVRNDLRFHLVSIAQSIALMGLLAALLGVTQ